MNDREYALLIEVARYTCQLLQKTGHMSSEAHELHLKIDELELYTSLSGYEED